MLQNTSVSATQSGSASNHGARLASGGNGNRLSINAATSVNAMNQGFTGRRMYCCGALGAGMKIQEMAQALICCTLPAALACQEMGKGGVEHMASALA